MKRSLVLATVVLCLLAPPAVHYLVVRRRRHRDGPAEMIRNAQAQVANYPLTLRSRAPSKEA